jgi:RNA polymerase sigma-70 factor (ECF subfamily)
MNGGIQSEKESKLIAAILAGDIQLYRQLIRPYERSVYILSFSYMKNEKDAEDVAQETFLRAFQDLWAFRGNTKFCVWLITIALREVWNRLQPDVAVQAGVLDEAKAKEMPASPALLCDWRELGPDSIKREEIRKLLQQAIMMLPRTYQQIFLLHDVQRLSVKEVAQAMDIHTSQVNVILHRARMMLQRRLAPQLKAIDARTSAPRDEIYI